VDWRLQTAIRLNADTSGQRRQARASGPRGAMLRDEPGACVLAGARVSESEAEASSGSGVRDARRAHRAVIRTAEL